MVRFAPGGGLVTTVHGPRLKYRILSLSEVQNWSLNYVWTRFECFKVQNANLTTTIYLTKTCLRGKTPPRIGHLAPASEVAGGLPF
jgi:hypothetical protein